MLTAKPIRAGQPQHFPAGIRGGGTVAYKNGEERLKQKGV